MEVAAKTGKGDRTEKPSVARVTAMYDCKWVNPATGQQDSARGKFDLAAGRIEIAYQTART